MVFAPCTRHRAWQTCILAVVVLQACPHGQVEVQDNKESICNASTFDDAAACNQLQQPRIDDDVLLLLEWASQQGAEGIQNLDLIYFNKSGQQVRGLATTRKLDWGEVAFRIPEHLILTQQHPDMIKSPFYNVTGRAPSLGPSFSMMLYLATERRRLVEGGKSFWTPYIRSIGTLEDFATSHPLFADAELTKSFKTLPPVQAIKATQLSIEKSWDKHKHQWASLAKQSGVDGLVFEDFKWAAVVMSSRSFTVTWSHHGLSWANKGDAMVPVADLLNHHHNNNVEWFRDLRGDPPAWEEKLERSIRSGSELTHSYGELTNDDFLLAYGFLLTGNPQRMTPTDRKPCAAKRLAKMLALEPGAQPTILAAFKSLLREYCDALPVRAPRRPAPPP